jgi:menaquinone-dependent protoporphyrinogen IX oxidase
MTMDDEIVKHIEYRSAEKIQQQYLAELWKKAKIVNKFPNYKNCVTASIVRDHEFDENVKSALSMIARRLTQKDKIALNITKLESEIFFNKREMNILTIFVETN